MQFITYPRGRKIKTLLFFFLVLVFAYLPVSSFLFYIKNDAFSNYFPPKFFISESLRSGYLPLWNPYINFGFPQYGDMNSGFWSPVTWLFAIIPGYNPYSFTIELLLYILLAGTGMYKLTGIWKLNNRVRIIAGIAFMCCGYQIGHLQHFNWISGAAFLPWCLWSYLVLLNKFSLRSVLCAALIFYLLIASAHPGIIIGAFYFFMGVCLFSFFTRQPNTLGFKYKKFLYTHLALLTVLLLLSAGLVTGYLDIVPHFTRGEKISLTDSLLAPTNLQSWISAILPFATVKNDLFYLTDPSMRNCYFSVTLLIFLLLACFNRKNKWQLFLLLAGTLFALLAAGGMFKMLAYKFIPMIGHVRLNGEFRIFSLLCFIIVAAIELDKYISQGKSFSGKISGIYYVLELLIIGALCYAAYQSFSNKSGLLYTTGILSQPGIGLQLKSLIDAISFYDTIWIQGIIQLLFIWGIKWCLKFNNWNLLLRITVINLIITSLMNIPFTGVGQHSVKQVRDFLYKAPKGIPIPVLQPIAFNDTGSLDASRMIGHWSMYNKQPGVVNEIPYPIILKNMRTYFDSDKNQGNRLYLNQPFLFTLPSNTINSIKLTSFSPIKISGDVHTVQDSRLVMQQNYYPNWYYINGGKKQVVNQEGANFMSIPLQKGDSQFTIFFDPHWVKWMMLLSAIAFLVCCTIFVIITIKSFYPS